MEFETVEQQCGHIHVIKNGVESARFVQQIYGDWVIMVPQVEFTARNLADALNLIAKSMNTWYTVSQAAVRLVELGAASKSPHRKTVCRWCREGRFLGAIKVGRGQGGSWRVSETALTEFAKRRKR